MTILYGEASIFQKPQKMQEDLHSQEFALIISVRAIKILKEEESQKHSKDSSYWLGSFRGQHF